MEAVSYLFNRTSRLLERLVCGRGEFVKAAITESGANQPYRSTAIQEIWAKPIIDILVEAPRECNLPGVKDIFVHNGYICMAENCGRISFNKGYTENGFAEKVFHLHLRTAGDNDELYFRDYLNEFPDAASQYEKIKLDLWKEYEHNRDGYTNAKSDFIKRYTTTAKETYGKRY